MKKKVIITKLPKADTGGGLNSSAAPWSNFVGKMSEPDVKVSTTLQPVPKEDANLEAEKGEVVIVPGDGGIPNTFKVGGNRHHSGGTPLNLPADSFIFSDTKKMLIKDKDILSQFGMSESKAGYTPADIAKKYDIGLYKKILLDKNTDKLQKQTAEQMIANYNLKLAKLAIVQESMKGFPQGLPQVAMPYIEEMNMDPAEFAQATPGGAEVSQVSESDFKQDGGVPQPKVQKGNRNFVNTAVNFLPVVETFLDGKDVWQGASSGDYSQLNRGIIGLAQPFAGKAVTNGFDYFSDKMIGTNQTDINANKRDNIINMGQADLKKLYIAYGPGGFDKWKQDGFPNLNTKVDDNGRLITPAAAKSNSTITIRKATRRDMGGAFDEYQQGGQIKTKKRVVYNKSTGMYDVYQGNKLVAHLNPPTVGGDPVGTTTTSPKVTSKVNIPADAIKFTDPNDPNIKPEDVKAGKVYIQNGDKWYKATGFQPTPYAGTFKDDRIKSPALNSSYGRLYDMFTNPNNADLTTDLVADYRKKVADLKPSKGLTQADIDAMASMDDQGVIKNFLDHELQIFALHSNGVDGTSDKAGVWDKDRKVYQDAASKLGFTPSTPAQTAAFQAAYKSLVDLSSGKYKDKLQNFELKPIGKADEGSGKNSNISGIDGWFGNTTVGQAAKYKPTSQSLMTEEVSPTTTTEYPLVADHLKVPEVPNGAPWWIQDIIKTGQAASNLANIRQFNPWQATAPVTTPDITFADPTRELAANAEQARIAADTVGFYTGPQAFNARFSEIQGNAMKGAADTLAKYNNINIGMSNQQSAQNAQLMNIASQQRANEQTSLWDKYQMTRQQFANAKTQAKDALVNTYTNGITNKANTYNLNQLYPQFAIDPMSGGQMYFKNPRDFFPKNESTIPDITSIYNKLLEENPTMKATPEKVWDTAAKMAGLTRGASFEDMMMLYQKANPAGAGYPPSGQ